MGTVQAVNILTGTPERVKYVEVGTTVEIWRAALTTALASGDIINGPSLPAGNYLLNLAVDWDPMGAGGTFEAGRVGALGAFIATGNTTPALGGIVSANVAGAIGFNATTDTVIVLTMTGTPSPASAGTVRIALSYTASP
jgi:hypothetical protein